jgi:hypothetical protein
VLTSTGAFSNARADAPYMAPVLPPQGVIGRAEKLSEILHRLIQVDDGEDRPVALHGIGGIGKTTLAAAVGRLKAVVNAFTGGVFWISLGPNPDIRNALTDWGDSVGIDLRPAKTLEDCRVRLRTALFDRRALLIVDDVWKPRHWEWFAVAGPQSRTLLTTRETPVLTASTVPSNRVRVDELSAAAALSSAPSPRS